MVRRGPESPPTPSPHFFVPIFENKEVGEILTILAPEIFGSKELAGKILRRKRLGEVFRIRNNELAEYQHN
jgi:hypothetical protein